MRKFLLLCLVIISVEGFAQPTNYIWYKSRERKYSMMIDSMLFVPRYNGTPSGVRVNENSAIDGAIAVDTANGRQYFYYNGSWRRLANYSELGVDSIWRVPGTDSIFWSKSGNTYKIKDSTGGGSTPTLQQVLTAGSTLTDNNTIDVDLNNFTIDRADNLNLFSTGLSLSLGTYQEDDDNVGSYISILRDSVRLEPLYGQLNIDSMRTWSAVADTQYKKPMTWDTRNGRWEYASNWFGGGGATPTLQQVLTAGSTLTTNNTIDAGGNNFSLTNSSLIEIYSNEAENLNIGSANQSDISIGTNLSLRPHLGGLYIDTLNSFDDTTNWKPMVYRTSTGQVRKATYWPGSVGGGTPAGNFGNLQINRNGAFATPGSDSLDFESATGLSVKGNISTTTELNAPRIESTSASLELDASGGGHTIDMVLNAGSTRVELYDTWQFTWGYPGVLSPNLGLKRDADAVLKITNGTSGTGDLILRNSTFSGRNKEGQGADVASANNLSLGTDGNTFEITGTTQINLIANTNWQTGSKITLLLPSGITIKHGQATSGSNITILLNGAADFVTAAAASLTLVYSEFGGTNAWREVSRVSY